MNSKSRKRAPATILVIAGSGIGNVLLATPLMRSLRRAFPASKIDVLVPRGRGDILEGNPDINEVVEGCRDQGMVATMRFVRRLWRRYDLTLSTQSGDRSIISSWIGGRRRFSHLCTESASGAWRKLLVHGWVEADFETHAVLHGLRLLDSLAMPKVRELVPPICPPGAQAALDALLPFS